MAPNLKLTARRPVGRAARLGSIAIFAGLVAAALWPAFSPYMAPVSDNMATCVAVVDGWSAEHQPPSQAQIAATIPPLPTYQQVHDPAARAHFRAEITALAATPAYREVHAYFDWLEGPGACVATSRHRLIESSFGLGALAVVAGIALGIRRSRRRRSPETEPPATESRELQPVGK